MLRYFYTVCATLVCFSLQFRAASETTPVSQFSNLLSYVTTVQNTAKIDFTVMAQKADVSWIEAKISPNKWSGAVKIGSSYLDADSGTVVKNPNGQDVIRVNGTFHIEAALTGKPEKLDYAYQWKFPFYWILPNHTSDPIAPYKIFINGGSAIFPITNDLNDPKKILPIYPIPTDWQEFVVPAWTFYQKNAALFQPQDAARNQLRLQQLLEHDNPFIAITACRVLAKAHLLDKVTIESALENATQLRQAVFTLLILEPSPVKAEEGKQIQDSVDVVTQFIAASNTPSNLRGIALGALTGLRELDSSGSVRSFKVLEALDKKHEALHTDGDGFVGSVLRMAVLPLLRQNPLYQATEKIKPAP